jgi:hypothetical protein
VSGLRRWIGAGFMAAAALLSACAGAPEPSAVPSVPAAPKVGLYELRVYTAAEGKMEALHARFRDHTLKLFEKHGMTNIGYFTPVTPAGQPADNRLFYILGHKDRAARDASWNAFRTDPDWVAAYQASQKDGSLTSAIAFTFYTPAEYAPAFNSTPSASPRHFELRTYKATPGKLENVHARFRDHTRRIFEKHGMTNIAYWRPVEGQAEMADKMTYMLAFPSQDARNASWRAFASDPEWQDVAKASEAAGPILAQPGAIVSVQLRATDYSPLK